MISNNGIGFIRISTDYVHIGIHVHVHMYNYIVCIHVHVHEQYRSPHVFPCHGDVRHGDARLFHMGSLRYRHGHNCGRPQ